MQQSEEKERKLLPLTMLSLHFVRSVITFVYDFCVKKSDRFNISTEGN